LMSPWSRDQVEAAAGGERLTSPRTRTTRTAGSRPITGQMFARSRCICGPTELSPGASRTSVSTPFSRFAAQARKFVVTDRHRSMLRKGRSEPMAALRLMTTRRDLPRSPYLAAVTGRKPSRVPVCSCGRRAARCPNTGRCGKGTACWRRALSPTGLRDHPAADPPPPPRRGDPVLGHRRAFARRRCRFGYRARRRTGDRASDPHQRRYRYSETT